MSKIKLYRRYILLAAACLLLLSAVIAGIQLNKGNPADKGGVTAEEEQEDEEEEELIQIKAPAAKARDEDKYTTIQENDRLRLEVSQHGKIAVTDKRNNYTWRSNPDKESLAAETVKGHWRKNLESAFYLEYTDIKAASKLKYGNDTELQGKTTVKPIDGGAEITYDLQTIESSFTFIVMLKDDHIEVNIPSDRIVEGESVRIVNLWAFPFLGASRSDVPDGHMFVPSGMGATIEFEQSGAYPFRYSAELYGSDLALSAQSVRGLRDASSEALLPVFGISYGRNALLGIITEGEANARINATPSGLYTSYNWIAPQFVYRQEYFRRTSSFGQGFNVFEDKRLEQDRTIRYYFLQGDKKDINYVGMAAAYRSYLMEEKGMQRIKPRSDHIPLEVSFFGGDREPSIFGSKLVETTTFDQAREIVDKFNAAGINEMNVTFTGWSTGGYMRYLPKRFPPENSLGGTDGLSRLIEAVHRHGNRIFLDDNYVTAFSGNGFLARSKAIRDSNARVVEDQIGFSGFTFRKATRKYWMQPNLSLDYTTESLPAYKELGIDGLRHDVIGDLLYSDNNPSNPYTREQTADVFEQMLEKTKDELGQVRVTHGNAYVLGKADHISALPLSVSYDLLAKQSVPFYPIAIHGLVTYSGQPGNLRDEYNFEMLNSVEYGALPAYLLTYEDPGILKDTYTRYIFSSAYSEWLDTIVEEYKRISAVLGGLQDSLIVNHRQIADEVFETTYDNGQSVVVNYGEVPYEAGSVSVKPKDFALVGREG
ncbi:DUF5696 domain-containing protein [Paenibacillus spongiae]|uniref:DUF5696 domain-containing protein n=1 Tax=Paenibacillus spongiae TaxID=2909671 RepID=A0ABY5SBX4_9BACL|nr:DUF5696 domain-containing protein [Paenibacillus spongiae]UVI31451.1 DUF5696 domain-containing protein [Paenibacillus spongiae]